MALIAGVALVALAMLALVGRRWAYIAFVLIGVLWIPARTGFRMEPPSCDLAPTTAGITASFGNVAHILLFALFFVLTAVQLRGPLGSRLLRAALIATALGVIVELEQGATRTGNCEVTDLIPNTIGILAGAALVSLTGRRSSP